MNESSERSVNAYWATMFGCDVASLRPARGRVFPHAGFAGYDGVYAMMFDEAAPIASVPQELLAHAQHSVPAWQPGSIRVPSQLLALLGARAGRVIGPALVAYADAATLRAFDSDHVVRPLHATGVSDGKILEELREACTPDEWEAGGSDFDDDVVFGAFSGSSLAALACYRVWGGCIAHIAVISHPAHRGRAFGKAAVLATAHHALAQGLVPQYRTLESNTASCRIATTLGFVPFATSLAVRAHVHEQPDDV